MTSTRANPAATREAGIAHVTAKLIALGWTVVRDGKTTRLQLSREGIRKTVQCRSVSKERAAGLGKGVKPDAADWWIVTTFATSAQRLSYICCDPR